MVIVSQLAKTSRIFFVIIIFFIFEDSSGKPNTNKQIKSAFDGYDKYMKNKRGNLTFQPRKTTKCFKSLRLMWDRKVRRSVVNPTDIDCNYNQCKTNLRTDDNRSVYGEQVGNGKRYFSNKCELCAQSCVEMKEAGTQRNSSNKIYILDDAATTPTVTRIITSTYYHCVTDKHRPSLNNVTCPCRDTDFLYFPSLPPWQEAPKTISRNEVTLVHAGA